MNWITADNVVSLFPLLTFNRRQSYINLPYDHHNAPKWVNKYEDRGFQIMHSGSASSVHPFLQWRTTNDNYCFRHAFTR